MKALNFVILFLLFALSTPAQEEFSQKSKIEVLKFYSEGNSVEQRSQAQFEVYPLEEQIELDRSSNSASSQYFKSQSLYELAPIEYDLLEIRTGHNSFSGLSPPRA